MKRLLISSLLVGGLATASVPARADIYVVVNAANAVPSLSQKEALDLFMGRSRHFSNGVKAQTFDLSRASPQRESFYRLLTGMDMAQVNSYWSRLMFSGQTLPPQLLANEEAMVDTLRRLPGAIGYLPNAPADRSLTVVLVLKEPR